MKRRLIYAGLLFFFLSLCFVIVQFFDSNRLIRGFLGDLIIVMVLYSFFKSIADFDPVKLSISIILFSFVLETLQYFKIVRLLGFQENYLTRIIFGSVFDPLDLLAYLIGVFLIFCIDTRILLKFLKKQTPSHLTD
ncbi:DUF2809 domain-containing protein [Leptospira sp. 201903070]|uniref:DUF2809 domain-containing protein n=1 Tax=Leptospira ainlahdjerensis TaxID=2810033 RepID=A0ABS2UB00_9LEPT|nr:DUF2809 domain-containing protein [Leptospira ainlahdjerensis]MBM9577546.1 DUF2809 domain-containing protein [Leptospira ainlahdjerensis]